MSGQLRYSVLEHKAELERLQAARRVRVARAARRWWVDLDTAVEALRPFAEAFARYESSGTADLDDEQPISIHVPMGAWRRARRIAL